MPAEVLDLTDLRELSLAGNRLTSLPEKIGCLTALERLQLAGNMLTDMPTSIGEGLDGRGWTDACPVIQIQLKRMSVRKQLTSRIASGMHMVDLGEE